MSFTYDGLTFTTRLEARWAAFFDLAGWSYWTNPVAVGDWKPDFKVRFRCEHSECGGSHTLFVAILPFPKIEDFRGHPCSQHHYGVKNTEGELLADGGAGFGISPLVTQWEISHGAGGGVENVLFRVDDAFVVWRKAGELVKAESAK